MTTAKKKEPAIDAEAHYAVSAARGFEFEGVEFGPLVETEVLGDRLTRLLASEHAPSVTGHVKKA